MTKRDKLIKRFKGLPKNFTFNELVTLFGIYGFLLDNKGTTSGSRVVFINEERALSYGIHKPHPTNIIKSYVMKQVFDYLIINGFVEKEEQEDK